MDACGPLKVGLRIPLFIDLKPLAIMTSINCQNGFGIKLGYIVMLFIHVRKSCISHIDSPNNGLNLSFCILIFEKNWSQYLLGSQTPITKPTTTFIGNPHIKIQNVSDQQQLFQNNQPPYQRFNPHLYWQPHIILKIFPPPHI